MDQRTTEALERIATALEWLATHQNSAFIPALPDPHEERRREIQAKAKGQVYRRKTS